MNDRPRLGLQAKINLTIAVILLVFFVLSTYLDYRHLESYVLDEAIEKARIVAADAIRAREYISTQLKVGGIDLSRERYGMIPVVASTRIGARVGQDLDYHIRQISDRYRNADNAPDAFESEVLKRFQADPYTREDFAITDLHGEPVFRYLQAFTAEQSCLECHGDPAAAPEFIKRMFPEKTDKAYNYKIGEIIGAASVTIPMHKLQSRLMANLRNDIIATGGIFLALIICLGFIVRMAVIRPLGGLGAAIATIMRTGLFEKPIPRRSRDEIGTLIDGFNEMMAHLQEKSHLLEDSERRYRVLTETARDAIVSFLGNGQIILFNRQAEKVFGYSKREILGERIERLVHEDSSSFHAEGAEAYLRKNADEFIREIRVVPGKTRDGRKIPLELSLSKAEAEDYLFYTAILREGEGGTSETPSQD